VRSATATPEQTSAPSALPGEVRATNDTAAPALSPRLAAFLDARIARAEQRLSDLARERREVMADLEELRAMREGPKPRKKPARVIKIDPAVRASFSEEELEASRRSLSTKGGAKFLRRS
jgi:hypothetical protein